MIEKLKWWIEGIITYEIPSLSFVDSRQDK